MKFTIKPLLSAVAALGIIAGGLSAPAFAAGPTIDLVDTNDTLTGSTISGYQSGTTLRLAIISNMGTVTWTNNGSGASQINTTGNTAQGVWLEGTQDQLNAALGEISVNKPCAGSYKIYAQVSDSGFVQDPTTGHLYQRGPNNPNIAPAIAEAAATPLVPGGTDTFGYLANATTTIENIIVANFFGFGWLGASDAATEGDWQWITGPEAGTSFYAGRGDQNGAALAGKFAGWGSGEPNDWGGNEDYAEILPDGRWNDISDANGLAYTIEWGGMPGDNLSSVSVVSDSIDISVVGAFTGAGTEADPYLINNATALHAVSGCGGDSVYFKQTANITLPSNWDGDQPFKGHYDGDNKKIIFGANTNVTHNTYGVWGTAYSGTFVNVDVSGDLTADGYGVIGLLYGDGSADVSDSKFSGSITATNGQWDFGSVSGVGGQDLTRVTSTVNFNVASSGEVGGLVGYYWGTIDHSSWNGTMSVTGTPDSVGGLVGSTDCASIYYSNSAGNITITGGGSNIGGLTGYFCGDTEDSFSTVDITAVDSNNVGGLAGRADGNFYRVAAFGDVSGNDAVGGLFGWASYNTTNDAMARGNVTALMSGGSLVGSIENYDLYRAYATGTVTAQTSRGALGQFNNSSGNIHWIPEQSTVTVPGSLEGIEVPYTETDAKDGNYYDNDGWNITNDWQSALDNGVTWTICSGANDGYPVLTSLYTEDPCADPQVLTPTPVIIGSGVEGAQLTGNPGTWDSGVTLTFAWLLDGAVIANEVGNTYTPVAGDVGKTVTFRVTSTKTGFRTAVKTSLGKVITAKPIVVVPNKSLDVTVGGFAGNSWWIPVGFVSGIKAGVKAHSKATSVTCIGIVAAGGNKAWQKTLGLKRAALACSTAKSFNSKLKTTLSWKVAAAADKVQRGATLRFNK